jgi:predicted enzyme related to lactoylglutathione lyase
MTKPTPNTSGKGSFWHSYMEVDDVDDCARRALSIIGTVLVPPHDVPVVGRICAVAGPTGAVACRHSPRWSRIQPASGVVHFPDAGMGQYPSAGNKTS